MDYTQQLIDTLEDHGGYSPKTIRFYREQADIIQRILRDIDPQSNPSNLSEETLKKLVQHIRSKYAVSTQKDYMIALKRMCEINDNYVFNKYRVTYPSDVRPNVDWLSFDQAKQLLEMWKMPMDEMLVTLELLHGLRRVETIRLCISDIHIDEGYIDVRGKGRSGGKLRRIPLHPDFKRSYDRWMEERNGLLKQTEGPQPDNLLVYLRGKRLHKYEEIKGRAIDDRLQALSERLGARFSSHTLRRTFGRELYRSGVNIVVIATIFGHTSTTQTIKYLGLDLDDMTDAMDRFKLRLRERNDRKLNTILKAITNQTHSEHRSLGEMREMRLKPTYNVAVFQPPLWAELGKSGSTAGKAMRPNPVGSTSNFSKPLPETSSPDNRDQEHQEMI